MDPKANDRLEARRPSRDHEERCAAPHPAHAFLLSLPAFASVIAAALVLWKFL